ncbi:universal stress protein [Lysobacter sp. S4-A87]|uniref:universal stress protein n=1 Tax=Lysobacter sp. S4-A87 TaxID=2925843 RepID=UPI001F52C6C4|nr:universal stress protein [Lysobacter sp. S4-A87]UNK49825.1 universal stress protein [Lysobacter sp. S4-A87]
MFKDLIVPLTDSPGDANALEAALALAGHSHAHLAVVGTIYLPAPVPGAWGVPPDASSMQRIYEETRAMAEAQAARLRERLADEPVPTDVRMVESMAASALPQSALHSHYADLVVMTSAEGSKGDRLAIHALFGALLLGSGRPVLVVPPCCKPTFPPRHAVVAWRPTRESTRALHDAMPILRTCASVDVVEVESGSPELSDDGQQPGADIAAHLARHDINVRVLILPQRGESVAAELIGHCNQSGAELLVAGGYGHSRFREWVLGGTTRDLLDSAKLPVLFSH